MKKPSGRWSAMYRDSNGKTRSAGTYDSRDRAKQEADNREAIERRTPTKATADLTWTQWKPAWWSQLRREDSTMRAYESRVRLHIEPRWGNQPISTITRHEVQEWVDSQDAEPSTVSSRLAVLSSSLTAAVDAGFIDTNPCSKVKLPTINESHERYLTDAEIEAIRTHFAGTDLLVYDLLLSTGVRYGELAGMHWDQIDFDNLRARISTQYVESGDCFKPTKGKQDRWIPLSESTVDALKTHLGIVGWGEPSNRTYDRVRHRYGLIIQDPDGPHHIWRFRWALTQATRKATITVQGQQRPMGHVRIHDLRHTFASRLVQNGIDIQTVSNLLGHKNLKQTQKYAKVSDARWNDVRQILEQ